MIEITMDGSGFPQGTHIRSHGKELPCTGMSIEQHGHGAPVVVLDLPSVKATIRSGNAAFRIWHPVDGELRAVKRIEFADGTKWEAP